MRARFIVFKRQTPRQQIYIQKVTEENKQEKERLKAAEEAPREYIQQLQTQNQNIVSTQNRYLQTQKPEINTQKKFSSLETEDTNNIVNITNDKEESDCEEVYMETREGKNHNSGNQGTQFDILKRGESMEEWRRTRKRSKYLKKWNEGLHMSDDDMPEGKQTPTIQDFQIFSLNLHMPEKNKSEKGTDKDLVDDTEFTTVTRRRKKYEKIPELQRNTRASTRSTQTETTKESQ